MRNQLPERLWRGRGLGCTDNGPNGVFEVPGPCGERLRIVASAGTDLVPWEHVSVSTRKRNPNWREMCFVKDLFWTDNEWVVQFHPPRSDYVNWHPHTLHLWRPVDGIFPTPPRIAV